MKSRTALFSIIWLVAMIALANTIAAQESTPAPQPVATDTSDAPRPRPVPLSRKSPIEIRYAFGVQNMTVPDVDSNTWGVHASAIIEGTLPSGIHLATDVDLFGDFDHDHLDPHHTPIWAQWHFGLSAPFVQSQTPDAWHISWVGDVDIRSNTVSSIERDLKMTAGIAAGGKLGILSFDARLKGGYYRLTIDDDVPTHRGYTRDDLVNQAWVLAPDLEASLQLTPHFKLTGRAQEWHDGSVWLETKYFAALDWDLSRFIPYADLMFSVEVTRYNLSLDIYHPAGPAVGLMFLPILPWDDDRLVKLSINRTW